MRNWKIFPKDPAVAQYIDCYWLLEKTPGDTGPVSPKLNPDPAAHIILAHDQQPYQYQHDSYLSTGVGSHLILPYQKTYTLDHAKPFLVLGIKLKVGALYSLPLMPTHPFLNEVVPIDVQQQLHITEEQRAALLDKSSQPATQYGHMLDNLLQPLVSGGKEDKHSLLVQKILAVLSDNSLVDTALTQMGEKLGCSQRTIERSFSKVTGITLKQYHSMQRLEAMLDHLHRLETSNINWSEVAYTFGFSDQPHLIRTIKSTLGCTPGKYAGERDLAIDAYGNFE